MNEDSYADQFTSPSQFNWSILEYQKWCEGKHPSEYTAYDGWMSAMQVMWGVPQSVGNLQSKIAELEERLSTIGRHHQGQIDNLHSTIARQAVVIQERDQEIGRMKGEVKTCQKNLDEFSRDWKKTVAEQHQAEIDEAIQDALQEEQERHQEILERTLRDQQEHFDNLKTAVLDAQRQVMLAEFQVQTTRMVERLETHYAERYRELEHTHRTSFEQKRLQLIEEARAGTPPQGFMSMAEYQEGVKGVEERLRREYLEELEAAEVSIRKLTALVEGAEQKTAQQIQDFTDRMLRDHHYRMGTLEDRINLRLDQGLTMLKGMVALEVRDRSPHTILDPKLPTDDDFEFWYDQIPENISMSDRDKFRAGWKEALSRLKID